MRHGHHTGDFRIKKFGVRYSISVINMDSILRDSQIDQQAAEAEHMTAFREFNQRKSEQWNSRFEEVERVHNNYKVMQTEINEKSAKQMLNEQPAFINQLKEGKMSMHEAFTPTKGQPAHVNVQSKEVDQKDDTGFQLAEDKSHYESIPIATQIHINRGPSDEIPPSLGTSVWGLHPHATSWTKAPAWAVASAYMGMAATATALTFSIYSLVQGIKRSRRKGETRLHARDWMINYSDEQD